MPSKTPGVNHPVEFNKTPFEPLVPRWPFSPVPTVSNWFRTTVNPLVWSLFPEMRVPVGADVIALTSRLQRDGLLVDMTPWMELDEFFVRRISAKGISKRGPVVLAFPILWQRIFELMSSGRLGDRDLAREIVDAIVRPTPPKDVLVRHAGDSALEVASSRHMRMDAAANRDALSTNLGNQLLIWRVRASGVKLRKLTQMAQSDLLIGKRTAERHSHAFTTYVGILQSSHALAEVASAYSGQCPRVEDLAVATLEDALGWLKEPS